MRHAIIADGVVINTAEASAGFGAAQGWVPLEGIEAGIGWLYEDGEFSPPPPPPIPVPALVTARQARLALLASDLLDAVEDALQALTGPEGRAARIEWEFATTIRRDSTLIAALAPVVGLSESEVDELFVMGAGL